MRSVAYSGFSYSELKYSIITLQDRIGSFLSSIRVGTDKIKYSDLHALYYVNDLLVRVRLAFQKRYLFPAFDQFWVLLLEKTNWITS